MKKVFATLSIIVIIFITVSIPAFACTSFAEYSSTTIYGMNFDYPDTDIRFVIDETKSGKAFSMEFMQGNDFVPTAGMNSNGLFVAVQMQYPEIPAKSTLGKDEIYIGELGTLIGQYDKVEQIRKFIKDKKLAPMPVSIHQLFADRYGNSMIVEVGDDKNNIVTTSDKFMVMTNFKNSDFTGKSYSQVTGVGDNRYKTAYEFISKNINSFSLESGWETLKKTVQATGDYPTQCSLVFDPQKGEIYIALKRDFENIWKVSLEKGTIQRVKGLTTHSEEKITHDGLLASDLVKVGVGSASEKSDDKASNLHFVLWAVSIVTILIILAICVIIVKKRRHNKQA